MHGLFLENYKSSNNSSTDPKRRSGKVNEKNFPG
jgi:hypothetical protein